MRDIPVREMGCDFRISCSTFCSTERELGEMVSRKITNCLFESNPIINSRIPAFEQVDMEYHRMSKICNSLLVSVLIPLHNWDIPKNTGRNQSAFSL
jgi:hypothetical protein